MSFLKWYEELDSESKVIPDCDNVPDTISFLNKFLDYESSYISQYKDFVKLFKNNKKQSAKSILTKNKIHNNINKKSILALKKTLKNDPLLRNRFAQYHSYILSPFYTNTTTTNHHSLLINPPTKLLHTLLPLYQSFPPTSEKSEKNETVFKENDTTENDNSDNIHYTSEKITTTLVNNETNKEKPKKIVSNIIKKKKNISNNNITIPDGASDFVRNVIESAN